MQRVTPVVILAFVAFAAAAVFIYRNSIRAQMEAVHQVQLPQRANLIANGLDKIQRDMERVAGGVYASNFASQAQNISQMQSSTPDLSTPQGQLLSDFSLLLSDNPGLYQSAAFVNNVGATWGKVTWQTGQIIQVKTFALDMDKDPSFQTAIAGKITLAPSSLPAADTSVKNLPLRFFVPISDQNDARNTLGVIVFTLSPKALYDVVNVAASPAGQRWLLVDREGHYLADSQLSGNQTTRIAGLDALLASDPQRMVPLGDNTASVEAVQIGNILNTGWRLVVIDSASTSTSAFFGTVLGIGMVSLIACILTLWLISRAVRSRLDPLSAATEMASQIANGDIEDTLTPTSPEDEMTFLIASFKRISVRLHELNAEMEEQANRHARGLEMAARVNHETAAITNPDDLVNRMIDLICAEFDLYHAQVYLLDDIGLNAVLMYSRGEIGQRLLADKLKVGVGSRSLIGTVTRTGKYQVVNDASDSGVYLRSTMLPETRAQLVLPLSIGEQILGALDIHSSRANVFQPEQIRLLGLLADQLASSLFYARQLKQAEQSRQQADTLNRQLTRSAWQQEEVQSGLDDAYHYDLMEVSAINRDEGVIEALSAPISIRGEVIGTIAAAAPEDQPFVEGDHLLLRAIAERVGLAIEGARLFKETQSSLAVTSVLYQLSQSLNRADTLEDVLYAILSSVMSEAASGQVWLFDDYMPGTVPQWLEAVSERAITVRAEAAPSLLRKRLYIPDSLFLSNLKDNQVKLVSDVSRDKRLDDELKTLFHSVEARALVLVPFSVRGFWRGIISVSFEEPRDFNENEERIYSALIDQAGVAIDNRLLIQQTELTLDQIERLYAASRIINAAQKLPELVRAAIAATKDPNLNFELGLLEGQLDKTGWPTRVRKVARSEKGQVVEMNVVEPLQISIGSPLRHREPQVTVDPAAQPSFVAIFPLFSINQPIALFYMLSNTLQELSAEDYEVYHALTGQMSTVLQNRQLLQQTEDALDESRRLYAASRAITVAQDSNAVYRAATDYLASGASYISRISIVLAGPDPNLDAAYFDYAHVWERHPNPESPVRAGLRLTSEAAPFASLTPDGKELLVLGDIDAELEEQPRLRVVLGRGGAVSGAIIPLRSQRTWFGILICESEQSYAFDDQYTRFAQAVADQIAIALENRLLFEEARAEAQRALALAEVGQLATRIGSEFEQSINEVFARVAEPAGYDRWMLMLTDEDEPNLLEKITGHAPTGDDNTPFSLDLDTAEHSLADTVRLNQLILINDPNNYPAFMGGRTGALQDIGKHIVAPVQSGGQTIGALLIGRSLDSADLDERDEQLVKTLAAQVAVAVENRRLFRAAENEREYLRDILETMPTGILVLDARSLRPIQANLQAEVLLGKEIDYERPFHVSDYNLYRTGTNVFYPEDELPIFVVAKTGGQDFSDDIAAIHDDGGQTDLLLNAAPIHDSRGNITAIVAAFQDISNLRGLENALQNNLRETIALYEATRSLSESREVDDALDQTVMQLAMQEPLDGYIVLLDETTGELKAVRGLVSTESFNLPHVVFDSSAVLISDVSQDARLDGAHDDLARQGIQSIATIPMRARDTLMGWIAVVYDQVHEYSPEAERFLTTLADSAATTLDNRNLFQRTEVAYQEATTLYEISRALANAATPDDILAAAVSKMKQSHVTQVLLAVPLTQTENNADETMQVVATWQREDVMAINLLGVTLTADQFPAWRQLCATEILMIDDYQTSTDLTDMERVGLESVDARSLAVLPLRAASHRIGVIWLASDQPYQHNERDYRLYQSFAEQASLSMEATRLLKQTERRARQLATSSEVSQIASSILDLNVLMPRLVNLIRDAFGYDHVQIFLMDKNDLFAELKASTGEAGQQLLAIRHKLAKGSASVIGTVTATSAPAIALDTADARFVHKPNPYLPLTRSEMALPLVVKGKVVGALDVQSNQPNAFTDEDVNVLTTLAAQISVAIDNARLFEQAEHRAQDMSFLFNITAAAAVPDHPLKESLQQVAEMAREFFRTLDVGIYLTETYTDADNLNHTLLRAMAAAGTDHPLSEISEVYVEDRHNQLALVAKSLEPRIINNIELEPYYLPITQAARAAVIVPMIAGNQLVGMLTVEDENAGRFTGDDVTLLSTLTSSISAIIQNAQLLEQVQRSNDQLRELDRLKSDFLANMSHELRTPLNSIIGFSRVILKGIDGPLTEMQEQDLSTIYNSGQHLLGLINDILDQAKINSGKMDLQKDYFEIKAVVEGVRSIGIGLLKDKPIEMRLDIASGLPKAYGDEFRTRQVLLNLVSNASKFTLKGSITCRAYTQYHEKTNRMMIRVDVVDTGIGIAEKDLPLLFEAFRQVDSSLTRTVGGTGLGLPIAKSLIEMQSGEMLVQSEVNVGSTFSILIPTEPAKVVEADEPPETDENATPIMKKQTGKLTGLPTSTMTINPSRPSSEVNSETVETNGTRDLRNAMAVMQSKRQILLIEESPDMVDQYRRALQREGFDVFAASIPLEAEAMASGLRPTIIIMDANFAKGAGWDILKRLQERDDTSDIPVIIASIGNDEARALQSGAYVFLQRPFMPDQLVAAVKKAETESQTERILIIDDQPETTRLFKQLLDEHGRYRVFAAHSGSEGISMVARRRPDLIILDLRMPEMDGFAVLEELRSNPEAATIPVMVVTADTLQSAEQAQLADIDVLYKTDLSQNNYQTFIEGVQSYLRHNGGH
jgi:GAF domain-containing protein/DNA-binding response OmpR family regulator